MPQTRLSRPEFIGLMAIMMAVAAFSTDAMLPAFPQIAAELVPAAPERASLLVAMFMLGMGVATFFTGPMSDAMGRKPVMLWGFVLYGIGSLVSWAAQDFTLMLVGRVLQGIGVAGARVVAPAMIRDLHAGREMAQITSFIMTVFMLVPAMAPMLGQFIIDGFGWRAIFLAFILMALVAGLWLSLRQPETLPPERRRPMTRALLASGLREVFSHREVLGYTLVMTLGFSILLTMISTIQPIYEQQFAVRETFPRWFMAGALIAGTGTLVNAWAVMRFGMRRLAFLSFAIQTVCAGLYMALLLTREIDPAVGVYLFFAWATQMFFMSGLSFGNLNALALQPLGHLAGLAASVITALSTVGAALVAGLVAVLAAGDHRVMVAEALIFSALCAWLLRVIDRMQARKG